MLAFHEGLAEVPDVCDDEIRTCQLVAQEMGLLVQEAVHPRVPSEQDLCAQASSR